LPLSGFSQVNGAAGMQNLQRMSGVIYRLVDNIAAFAFGAMFVLIIIQVIWRYLLSMPLSWPEEAARTCFLWLSYLGLITVLRNKESYRIEYFFDRFPPAVQLISAIVIDLFSIFFLILMILGAWPVMVANWGLTTSISTPINILYVAAPLASVFILPFFLKSFCEGFSRIFSNKVGGK
jgi:TRAP-type C4-dicarboxylate transport system permease small subunit